MPQPITMINMARLSCRKRLSVSDVMVRTPLGAPPPDEAHPCSSLSKAYHRRSRRPLGPVIPCTEPEHASNPSPPAPLREHAGNESSQKGSTTGRSASVRKGTLSATRQADHGAALPLCVVEFAAGFGRVEKLLPSMGSRRGCCWC
jgi:hypothetical protein